MTISVDISAITPISTIYKAYTATYGNHKKPSPDEKKMVEFILDKIKMGHVSPLKQSFIQISCEAPIYVARQLAKHQIGMSWNEISRRYTDKRISCSCEEEFIDPTNQAIDLYHNAVEMGMDKEKARQVLPLCLNTEWIWSGSALAFANLYWQRTSEHAQQESQDFAEEFLFALEEYNSTGYSLSEIIKVCASRIKNF